MTPLKFGEPFLAPARWQSRAKPRVSSEGVETGRVAPTTKVMVKGRSRPRTLFVAAAKAEVAG